MDSLVFATSCSLLISISGFPHTVAEKREICYNEIGCFDLEPPWVGVMGPLPAPQSPKQIKPEFYIVTRKTISKPREKWRVHATNFYQPSPEILQELDYQRERERTVVLIHGMYVGLKWNWSILERLAEAYLSRMDTNVIIVKYSAGGNRHLYTQLVANIRVVGAVAAKFLEQLMKLMNLKTSQIHIIGFSLGGHTAGYVGKRIPNIYRITGLDIAGPLFRNADPRYRLHYTDAEHVDVLHTDSVPLIGLGYRPPVGKVDFYFNGNANQFGPCIVNFRNVFRNIFELNLRAAFTEGYLLSVCSHIKVIEYWVESLENSNCTMWGTDKSYTGNNRTYGIFNMKRKNRMEYDCTKYQSCAPVGLDTFDYVTSGIFYVRTKLSAPYCLPSSLTLTLPTRTRSFRIFDVIQFWRTNESR